MNTYYFDKKINLEEAPDQVNSVVLENSFDYVHLNSGVHVSGKIGISGECKCQEHVIPFVDTLDVDLIVPSENIAHLKSLKLVIDNYDCHIVDDSIHFRIKCNLNGYDEDKENFQVEQAFKDFVDGDSEKLVQEFRDTLSQEEAEKLENLMKDDVDIFVNNSEDEVQTLEEDIPSLSEEENDVYPFVPYEDNPVEVDSSVNNEAIDNVINETKAKTVEKEIETNQNSLFGNERFVVFSRFYRCVSGDTYETIALKYDLNPYDLKDLNKNKVISEGTLIQIPR
ncbi:MAG: hypothetical protein J1F31_04495 [Erysipelotrichales bacterium]|nr:hypothetical protein [Erysipelotrichales bacterium]